jgi:hypothetical protein
MRIIFVLVSILFLSLNLDSQNFKYVSTNVLNIREKPSKISSFVCKLKKGEKVTILSDDGKWSQIETSEGISGFAKSKYLNSELAFSGNLTEDVGFKYGFYKPFKSFFILFMFVFGGIDYYKTKRIRDGRHSGGFRVLGTSPFDMLMYGLYSSITCSVLGLFSGFFYWVKSF